MPGAKRMRTAKRPPVRRIQRVVFGDEIDLRPDQLVGPGGDDAGEWNAVVSKPYDPQVLIEAVHRAIANRVAGT